MEGASETVCERLLKLRFDRPLVDHRPDLRNSLVAKLIEDVLGEGDPFAVHWEIEEETLRPAVEFEAGSRRGAVRRSKVRC